MYICFGRGSKSVTMGQPIPPGPTTPGGGGGGGGTGSSTAAQRQELILTNDLIHEVSNETPLETRLKTIKELTPAVREQRLQDHGVELLWMKTKDLMDSSEDEQRSLLLRFYEALVRGQYDRLDIMRAQFFRLIESHSKVKRTATAAKKDLKSVLQLLDALTRKLSLTS